MADLADGESIEMQGSGAKPYILKNTGGVFSCTCPAWCNQSLAIEKRTCKHLRKLRGDEAEKARCGSALPTSPNKPAIAKSGPPILLAQAWDNATDLKDWWMSEKLDGVRAFWDGQQFLSRQGNLFHAPDWFIQGLPQTALDGELWIDRKAFQRTVSIVRRQDKSEHWREVRFLAFDAPHQVGGFEERIAFLTAYFGSVRHPHCELHVHERCQGTAHLKRELARIEQLGGEGLMLRQPMSSYEIGRSCTLLKVKSFQDAEATVVEHVPGKGKHKGRLGALVCQLADGTQFSVGTGFSDRQREDPPAVGTEITFRFQELSDGGVPRFPSFVRARESIRKPVNTRRSVDSAAIQQKKIAGNSSTKKSVVQPTQQLADATSSGKRYFEFSDEKSNKFWEVEKSGIEVAVRYGRVGSAGTSQTKSFADEATANKHVATLIEQKTDKGYVEK